MEGSGAIRARAGGHFELVADPRLRVFVADAMDERTLVERLADVRKSRDVIRGSTGEIDAGQVPSERAAPRAAGGRLP
jgi:hypothetical protein